MHTREIRSENFRRFRRQLLRNGGAIVSSAPVPGGYSVTYVSRFGA